MELWDLYDKNRVFVKSDHIRGEKIEKGLYHLCVHVWIKNSDGKFLISQRNSCRPTFPSMWECVGGSAIKGEDSYKAAIRETIEEVGLDLRNSKGVVINTVTREEFNDIMDVWLFTYDGELTFDKRTTDETSQVKWMSVDEIKTLWKDKKFVPTLFYFFDILI